MNLFKHPSFMSGGVFGHCSKCNLIWNLRLMKRIKECSALYDKYICLECLET